MGKQTWTYKEDLPDQANGNPDIETMQEEYLIERIGNVMYASLQRRLTNMSELTITQWRDDMIISRGMVYGKELDEYVWQQVEKAAIKGFLAGALVMCIIWMIVLGI